jgi:hypothetical protein
MFFLSLSVLVYETTTYIRPFCTLRSIQLEEDLVHLLILTCSFPGAKVKFRNRNERKREEYFRELLSKILYCITSSFCVCRNIKGFFKMF